MLHNMYHSRAINKKWSIFRFEIFQGRKIMQGLVLNAFKKDIPQEFHNKMIKMF